MREGSARRSLIAFVAAFLTLFVIGPRAFAAQNDCLVSFKGVPSDATNGGSVTCDDCNAACDTDGVNTPNKACTFNIAVCANQPGSGCTAADIKKVTVKKASGNCKLTGLKPTPNGTSSVCGAFTGVVVKEKKNGKKAGKCKILVSAKSKTKPRQVDKDILTLTCTPQTATTCPTTTTTVVTPATTTTTIAPRCGDGKVDTGEQCDPPCGTGCGAGQICNSTCQCVAAAACACGTPDPATLHFTTMVGSGNCGSIQNSSGATLAPLTCGGLYFGGGGDAVPLPAIVPDMGVSVTKTCCNGSDLTLAATTPTDTGSPRNCSGKDCLFGAPLPIPNTAPNASALSTCVINVIAQNAVGSLSCTDGSSTLDLPLTSEVYLFGDLLNGSAADRPDVPGIQPCPICSRVCTGGTGMCNAIPFGPGCPCAADGDCQGGTCAVAATCLGGPNHGMACTPADTKTSVCEGGANVDKPCTGAGDCPGSACSTLRSPYPTTHDCPVPNVMPIGSLPIPFALTTGTSSDTAKASGSEQRVFCGFCRDVDDTFCFEGDPGTGCPPGNGLHPCESDSDCAQPYEACEQKTQGAFGPTGALATTLSSTGTPAGAIATGNAPQASTLVSIFCIPPTFNPAIDAAADLPGPGAVALPGTAQLLP